jgi:hypothetical protein
MDSLANELIHMKWQEKEGDSMDDESGKAFNSMCKNRLAKIV